MHVAVSLSSDLRLFVLCQTVHDIIEHRCFLWIPVCVCVHSCVHTSFFCSTAIVSLFFVCVCVHVCLLVCSAALQQFLRLVSFRYPGSAGSNDTQVYSLDVLQEQPRPKLS
jgi:hypothetical protein